MSPENSVDRIARFSKANIVLQVHRSHLDRVTDLLESDASFVVNIDDEQKGKREDGGDVHDRPSLGATAKIVSKIERTTSKSCSLVFLNARPDGVAFLRRLTKERRYALKCLNKAYVMSGDRVVVRGHFGAREGSCAIDDCKHGVSLQSESKEPRLVERLLEMLQTSKSGVGSVASTPRMVVKVECFPAGLQRQALSALDALLVSKSISENEIDIAPTDHTHVLTIVQLNCSSKNKGQKRKNGDERNDGEVDEFLVGVSPVEQTFALPMEAKTAWGASLEGTNDNDNSNGVCRAFYKLEEAFERYRGSPPSMNSNGAPYRKSLPWPFALHSHECDSNLGHDPTRPLLVAADVGASPGGWTKYLAERIPNIGTVYAIDPGELDCSVAAISSVSHLKMRIQEAVPQMKELLAGLGGDNNDDEHKGSECDRVKGAFISLWCSDMCVHEVSSQVDAILLAKREGILHPNGAAFVLTIKCNTGHSKERFDSMTETEVERLRKEGANRLKIVHLFSNRGGERTVIGFI